MARADEARPDRMGAGTSAETPPRPPEAGADTVITRLEGSRELEPAALCWRCEPDSLDFETTEDLEEITGFLGQPRAQAALELGTGIDRRGFNIFAFGPTDTGRHHLVQHFLAERAAERPVPRDCCYVHNFEQEHKPRLLRLPAGKGRELRKDMDGLVEELGNVLPAAFESEEYQSCRRALDQELESRQEQAWRGLSEEAEERGLSVSHTPMGLVFAPTRDGETLSSEEYQQLPEEERERLTEEVERLRGRVEKILRQVPGWMRERRRKIQQLNREMAERTVEPLFDELEAKYDDVGEVVEHLERVQEDVVENAHSFLSGEGDGPEPEQQGAFRRYKVNLLVDHGDAEGAPVIYEDNPTLSNLVGKVEHLSRMGTLVTDFLLIKPGALQRADGGYLLLDADKVLRQPMVWDALKRALRSGQVKVESLAEALSLLTTVSLEPEPLVLEVKVVLVGEPLLYYLLSVYDPEFGSLFKVAADFSERLDREPDNVDLYVRLLAGMVQREELRPLSRGGVARTLEHATRMTRDAHKLTLRIGPLLDLLREADHHCARAEREVITEADVQAAIDGQIYRSDRLREEVQERVRRGTVLIETRGARTGQVNGLSVLQLNRFAFGHPVRITARVRLGEGEVVDIEREVELSGPIHSKGVLILSGFLSQRYVPDLPLSLAATLVFEQSYGGVEGDSASLAELCALLSALGEVPLDQSLAITGSVNQHGRVQAIGGINEKIEGFFDACAQDDLTGRQGVIMPQSNVQHLILRQDVVDAVEEGRFHVYPVETVDQALELLTGLPAGERAEDGLYPEGAVNARVEERLATFASLRMAYQQGKLGEAGEISLPAVEQDGNAGDGGAGD